MIFSKKLLNNTIEEEQEDPNAPVKILGTTPPDFYATNYRLMKRGNEFFALYENSPENGMKNINVQTLNFISKTTDFKNWTGSGIGSGYTRYDEQSDSFYSTTLAVDYDTKNGPNITADYVTKINPDTFEYTTTVLLPQTSMSQTSRGLSSVQRIGNYLIIFFYKGQTQVMSAYSTDNGNTWNSTSLSTVSMGIGGSSINFVSNGTKGITSNYFGSTTQTRKCFSSPTNYVNSNCQYGCKGDRPIYTTSNNLYSYNYSSMTLSLTTDCINYSKTINVIKNTIGNVCVFYDKYVISANTMSYSLKSQPDDVSYYGKIVLYDTSNGDMYYFDTGLDIPYQSGSGDYIYVYSYIQVVGFIDDEIYFVFQCQKKKSYQLAKVHISYVIENMVKHV